jgi:glutathione synthase/RimK-type ligase-like ATP-grasp enzyme
VDEDEEEPPSNQAALQKFVRCANRADVDVEFITKEDFTKLGVFDALFIRVTTYVNHYTYRFARRAMAEGLAVIDDPVSIARCTNKVYLHERLSGQKVPTPPTLIVHKGNIDQVVPTLGLPVVLKQPDSAFSMGVTKVSTAEECKKAIKDLLDKSDMIIAQAFMPTEFDWRVGVIDGKPFYVSKYYMARSHWQVTKWGAGRRTKQEGRFENLPVEKTPRKVLRTAVKAAKLIGDGLYGVDLKEVNGEVYVIEVNDNPSLDAGIEDTILKDQLYDIIVQSFIRRILRLREGNKPNGRKARTETL